MALGEKWLWVKMVTPVNSGSYFLDPYSQVSDLLKKM